MNRKCGGGPAKRMLGGQSAPSSSEALRNARVKRFAKEDPGIVHVPDTPEGLPPIDRPIAAACNSALVTLPHEMMATVDLGLKIMLDIASSQDQALRIGTICTGSGLPDFAFVHATQRLNEVVSRSLSDKPHVAVSHLFICDINEKKLGKAVEALQPFLAFTDARTYRRCIRPHINPINGPIPYMPI